MLGADDESSQAQFLGYSIAFHCTVTSLYWLGHCRWDYQHLAGGRFAPSIVNPFAIVVDMA